MPGLPFPKRPTGRSARAKFFQTVHDFQHNYQRTQRVDGAAMGQGSKGTYIIPGGGNNNTSVDLIQCRIRLVKDDYLVCREWDGETLGTSDVLVAKPWELRNSRTEEENYALNSAGDAVRVEYTFTYEPDESEPFLTWGEEDPENPGFNIWGETAADFEADGDLFEVRMNVIRNVSASVPATPPEDPPTIIPEQQRVVPVWLRSDVIYAIEADTGVEVDGASVGYLYLSGSRMWARVGEVDGS